MFILAYRFCHETPDRFPHDAYPVETAWTASARAPKLVRKMVPQTARLPDLQMASARPEWHQLIILARSRSSRVKPELKGESKCVERIPTRSRSNRTPGLRLVAELSEMTRK